MDRTKVSGAFDLGSTPNGGAFGALLVIWGLMGFLLKNKGFEGVGNF